MVCFSCSRALLVVPFVVANDVLAQAAPEGGKSIGINPSPLSFLDESLGNAIGEAATVLFSFAMVVLIARALGYAGSANQSPKKSRSLKKSVSQSQAQDGKVLTASTAKKSSNPRSVATTAPQSDVDRISAAANFLAGAVNAGKAAKLPQMLDEALARLSASRPSTEKSGAAAIRAAQQLLLSSVRACASKRCFREALAAHDHMKNRIGDGCSATWSLLLWSSVEANLCDRGSLFAKKLRATGDISQNDFVNLVRCSLNHNKDVKQFIGILEECNASDLKLDILTRNRALAVLTSNHAMDFAAELVARTADIPLDVIAYNTMMKGFALAEKPKLCLQLYEQMRSADILPSDVTFGILLDACVGVSMLEEAKLVFDDLKASNSVVNVVHYTTFIKGLVSAGCLAEARDVLLEMHNNPQTRPDVITYSTLAKAYADNGDVDDGVNLLEMMRDQGIEPDAILFNIILSACSAKPMEGDKILGVFEKVLSFGFRPTSSTYSVLIKACAKSECWELALGLVRSAPSRFGIWPEARIYAQLGQACATAGAASAVLQTYTLLVEACGARGEVVDNATNMRFLRFCSSCGVSPDAMVTRW